MGLRGTQLTGSIIYTLVTYCPYKSTNSHSYVNFLRLDNAIQAKFQKDNRYW
jgi:hypothetical protein